MVQKTVELTAPIGIPGQVVALQEESTAVNYLSDGTLHAGGFAFVSKEAQTTPKDGVELPYAGNKGDVFLGVVVFDRTAVLNMTDPCNYQKGEEVYIVRSGDVIIKAPKASAKVGQHVLVKTEDGTVDLGDKATEGQVDTGWVVMTEGKQQNDLIIISNSGDVAAKGAASEAA